MPRDLHTSTIRSASWRLAAIGFSLKIARTPGFRASDDDLRVHADWKDGRGDVNLLVGQEVFVAFVDGGDAETFTEEIEVPAVGVGGGDQLTPRVQFIATGMIRAHPSHADHRYSVLWG